jgi:hypothetical protein
MIHLEDDLIQFDAISSPLDAEELDALGLVKIISSDKSVNKSELNQLCGLVNEGYCKKSRDAFEFKKSETNSVSSYAVQGRSKRLSDEDMKREAYETTLDTMTSFACTSSCKFQCSQKITLYGQRQQFMKFWGAKDSKDIITTSERKAKLETYMKRAYNKETRTFRFFTVETAFVPSFEICEYAAAQCLCINPYTSRIWESSKRIAKTLMYDSLGNEIPKRDDEGRLLVLSFLTHSLNTISYRNTNSSCKYQARTC